MRLAGQAEAQTATAASRDLLHFGAQPAQQQSNCCKRGLQWAFESRILIQLLCKVYPTDAPLAAARDRNIRTGTVRQSAMAEHPHAERDEDLELALKLHRELNAVPRRQRQQPRTQAATAALKTLSKKHHRQETEESSSESDGAEERGSQQKKRRGGGGAPSGACRGVVRSSRCLL